MRIIRDLLNHISSNFKQYLLDGNYESIFDEFSSDVTTSQFLKSNCVVCIAESKLKHQINTLQLVTKYFDVIIWCLDCGLLPEKVAGSSDKCVPIYLASILQYTEQR